MKCSELNKRLKIKNIEFEVGQEFKRQERNNWFSRSDNRVSKLIQEIKGLAKQYKDLRN